MVAHGASGGATPSVWALAVLPIAVALFAVLVRRAGDVAALGAASLLVQVAWHLLLMLTPAGSGAMHGAHGPMGAPAASHAELGMLLAHLTVAALTVVPCLGVERTLDLLAGLPTAADGALAATTRLVLLATSGVVVPTVSASTATVALTPVRLRSQWTTLRHPDRGPPARRPLLTLAA